MYSYHPLSNRAEEFINHQEILDTIEYAKANKNNKKMMRQILAKAEKRNGITHREASTLLECEDPQIIQELFDLAKKMKSEIFGRRIVLFAPLYLSNYCVNGCTYCPYHKKNTNIRRKKLSQQEIVQEVIALQDMGHKRLALESGEDPVNSPIEYILESIQTIYGIHHKNGAIRRVNINIAATSVENYRRLKEAGIGTYILFQETYHRPTYESIHPTGPKHNYAYHTEAMDRAMEGGVDDVGIGVLFGLYKYRYDFAGLLMHAEHLEQKCGVGPHTISVPRIRPADDVDLNEFPDAIVDSLFKKIVAIIRIFSPYTGIIMSTREPEKVRRETLEIGVSQISGASSTSVGGYVEKEKEEENSKQFETSDQRTLDEVIEWLLELGYVPSFCTACYREGRTGDRFMSLAKSGHIRNVCQPNSLITLKEYLLDYASPKVIELGEYIIEEELQGISSGVVRNKTEDYLVQLEHGSRDFRF